MTTTMPCTHPECYEDVDVRFEYEREDAEADWPAEYVVLGIATECTHQQDEEIIQDRLGEDYDG